MAYKKLTKSGQMKIQQMAFMLIAVTLFFALVGLFVMTIVFSNLRGSADLLEEKNALLLVSKLAESAEFSCGEAFSGSRTNCVDFDKVMALEQNIGKYSGFWDVSGIEIKKILNSSETGECSTENYPNCGEIKILEAVNGTGVSNFISLCRKERIEEQIQDKCEVARLIVTYNGDENK